MKKAIVLPSAILIIVNVLLGLILSQYSWFNVVMSSVIILLSAVLIHFLYSSNIKSAFKISLTTLFIFNEIVAAILGILSPASFKDNWYLIVVIALFAIELIVWAVCSAVSSKVQ